jgi:hypothetical protein
VEGHERHHIPLGARHGLVAGNPLLNGAGERRKLSCLDKTEELLSGDVGARLVRHRGDEVLGGREAPTAVAWRMQKDSEHRSQAREEEEDGKTKSRTSARRAVLKGAGATPHLRHQARRVSGTFAHTCASPGETTTHSRNASVPAKYGPADSARSHDGTVTSVTSAEMPAPITTPTITTTAMTAPTKHLQATTATITNKSSRASLQLTRELGGYIRRMRSRAPTENVKNTTNTKTIRLSLSTTP